MNLKKDRENDKGEEKKKEKRDEGKKIIGLKDEK